MIMKYEEALDVKVGDTVAVAPLEDIITNAKEKGYSIRTKSWDARLSADNIDIIFTPCHFVRGMFKLCSKEFRVIGIEDEESWVSFILEDIQTGTTVGFSFDNEMLIGNEGERIISDEDFDTLFGGIE